MTENEKYLDSIQGRIDLLNNAVQTLWINTIDDSVIKFFVNLGTQLVKIADSFGLIRTLIIAIGAFKFNQYFGEKLFGDNKQNIKEIQSKIAELQSKRDLLQDDIKNSQSNEDFLLKRMRAGYDGAAEAYDKAHDNTKNLQKELNNVGKSLDDLVEKERLAGNAGQRMWDNIKSGAKKAWKEIKKFAQSMLIMTAITGALELVGKIFSGIYKFFTKNSNSVEKANKEFDDFKSKLSDCKSELNSLESELKSNQDAIDELMSQDTLTYVEQEELERLKSVTSELKHQIELRKTLEESLQKGTNSSSVTAAKTYLDNTSFKSEKSKTERQEEAKEQGEEIGKYVGLGIGALAASIVAIVTAIPTGGFSLAAIPSILGASAVSIGMTAGAGQIVGQGIGGAVGAAAAGSNYDKEQNVQDAIKNMKAQRQALIDAQNEALANKDTKAYNDATEALGNYDKQMSAHISQMSEYYNAIDWATATDGEKEYARYLGDLLDTYNISMGAAGSTSSAIDRIFGSEATDGLKKVKKAWEENTDKTKDFSTILKDTLSPEEYDAFVSRLHEMGLYVVDLEKYFKEVEKAEDDALSDDLSFVANDVYKVVDALENLKSAFDEINEKGYLTVKTFESLKEIFANNSDALAKYANVVLSGTASTEEMIKATEELAKAYIDDKILNGGEITALERVEYIVQLKELGVTNAEEYVDDKIRENAYKEIENSATYDYDAVKQKWLELNYDKTEEDYNDLTQAEIDAWAKENNFLKEISQEDAKAIAEKYGIEIENIDSVIDKLEELANAETKAKQAQEAKDEYDSWIENYNKKQEEIAALEKSIGWYDPNATAQQDDSGDYQVWNKQSLTWESMTADEYEKLKEQYNSLVTLRADFENLQQEGTKKGWVNANGTLADGVSAEFEKAYNDAKDEKEKLEGEIETELTADIQLKLELQNKSELVDELQSIYDTLYNATKEYADQGYFNVDTVQSLLQIEPKYLQILYDENGQLKTNASALYELTAARVNDMGIQAAQNLFDKAREALDNNKIERMRELTQVTYGLTEANWILYDSMFQTLQKDAQNAGYGDFGNSIWRQYLGIRNMTQNAANNIQRSISSADDTAKDDAFQRAMKYWENRIGAKESEYQQVQNEIDLLEKQGKQAGEEYYKEQIKLQQEKLSLLEQQEAEARYYLGTFKEGSDEWFLNEARLFGNE